MKLADDKHIFNWLLGSHKYGTRGISLVFLAGWSLGVEVGPIVRGDYSQTVSAGASSLNRYFQGGDFPTN